MRAQQQQLLTDSAQWADSAQPLTWLLLARCAWCTSSRLRDLQAACSGMSEGALVPPAPRPLGAFPVVAPTSLSGLPLVRVPHWQLAEQFSPEAGCCSKGGELPWALGPSAGSLPGRNTCMRQARDHYMMAHADTVRRQVSIDSDQRRRDTYGLLSVSSLAPTQ